MTRYSGTTEHLNISTFTLQDPKLARKWSGISGRTIWPPSFLDLAQSDFSFGGTMNGVPFVTRWFSTDQLLWLLLHQSRLQTGGLNLTQTWRHSRWIRCASANCEVKLTKTLSCNIPTDGSFQCLLLIGQQNIQTNCICRRWMGR